MFILHFRRYFQALCKQKESKEVLGIEQKVTLGHFHKAAALQATQLGICSLCWTAGTCGEEFGTKWGQAESGCEPERNLSPSCSALLDTRTAQAAFTANCYSTLMERCNPGFSTLKCCSFHRWWAKQWSISYKGYKAMRVITFLDWCDLMWQSSYDLAVIPLY